MRPTNTPPAGAGRGQATTKTERLLNIIEGLGTDKHSGNPIGIRTKELAERGDVIPSSVGMLLAPHAASGRIRVCKVTTPGSPPQNEYRRGIGVAAPDFKPLSAKRAGIAIGPATKPPPVTTPAPAVSTAAAPTPAIADIRTPTLITKTHPEVVAQALAQTPAAGGHSTPRAAPAVAAVKATPKPPAGDALKKEPATRKASAGDDLRIGINDAGTLVIAVDDESIELNPKQARKLGHFMSGTAGVWNPF